MVALMAAMTAGDGPHAAGPDGSAAAVVPLPRLPSPEHRFVFAVARQVAGAGEASALNDAAMAVRDWQVAVRGIDRHGLLALSAPVLTPLMARPDLADAAARDAYAALRTARSVAGLSRLGECVRIARGLDQRGIRYVCIKGAALSVQLYGDAAARGGRDIDIVVERARFAEAEAMLAGWGYTRPGNGPARIADPDEPDKESAWIHRERGVLVELHDRLTDNAAMLPWDFERLWAAREMVTVAGYPLPAMARADLPLYLAVHGVQSGWARLMWLCDLALLLPDAAAQRRACADAASAGMAGMMLHVCRTLHQWLALPVDADLLRQGRRRVDVRLTGWLVMRFHTHARWYEQPPARSWRRVIDGGLWGRSITYVVRPSARFWRSQMARDLTSPHDRALFALPRGLAWLYPALRPLGWVIRRLRP